MPFIAVQIKQRPHRNLLANNVIVILGIQIPESLNLDPLLDKDLAFDIIRDGSIVVNNLTDDHTTMSLQHLRCSLEVFAFSVVIVNAQSLGAAFTEGFADGSFLTCS